MVAKQVTKRSHWVPQVYLRAFAADARRRKIWRFSKNLGDPQLKSIEKVAVRFHLYAPMDQDGRRDDSLERKLSDLEQWFDSPFWRALQEGYPDLGWEPLRKMVALLAATMFMRTPAVLEMMQMMHADLVEMFSGPLGVPSAVEIGDQVRELNPSDWPAYRDASMDDIKRFWNSQISRAGTYAEMLMTMRWSMLCSDEPVFITTDNPVGFIHPSLKFRGVKDPETMVMFPISPTRVLSFDQLHREPANQYYKLKGTGAVQNLLIWRNSIEYMFSHRDPDLVCAELLEDAGYRGHNAPLSHRFRVYTSGQKRRMTPSIKREMKRPAAVEPVIGHIKNEHRMSRNYLAGTDGDAINAILAAAGYNFSLLLNWLRRSVRLIGILLLGAISPLTT